MKESFDTDISEEFEFVKAFTRKDDKSSVVLRHKATGLRYVRHEFTGSDEVYRILQKISNRNLPRVYYVENQNGKITVLEEYISGITVADVLAMDLYTEDGARKITAELCNALAALHAHSIIHRDIKPENVMITDEGGVKLIDFDASRVYKAYKSEDTAFVGTAGFAAPEQFGISQTDARSDIFALGILMNVMLTGQHPSKQLYTGNLAPVIEKCINIDPNRRYGSAAELFSVL